MAGDELNDAGLPKGWVWATLGQIADTAGGITKGRNYAGKLTIRLPYLRVANVQRGYLALDEVKDIELLETEVERYQLRMNDLVLTEGGDWDKLGRCAVWKGQITPCVHQNHIFRARLHDPELPAEWLMYYINSKQGQEYFSDAAKQTTNLASINLTQLRNCPIPMAPPSEQRRILAKLEQLLSGLDAGIASLKRIQAALKRYRAAVLKAACEGRLVPQNPNDEPAEKLLERILAERRAKWEADLRAKGKDPKKAKYVEPARPETEGLPELPEGWCWATWDQLSPRVTVGFVGPMKHEYVDSGVPFLRSQNVRENRYKPEGLCYISERFHREIDKSTLHPGDLVVVRSGSVGVTCVIPDTLPEANCADLVVIQKPPEFEPLYGSYYMNSLAKRHVTAGKVGIALTHFNTKAVAALPVAVPPLAEQRRIVTEVEGLLSVTQESEHSIDASLARASRLRQAFLRRAFEGKLVAQNPSDEPASAILERIRHGRESAAMYNGEGKGRRGRQQRLPL